MTEQPNHGQPNQQPYPYQQPPNPRVPPPQQQPYQNPYGQQPPQQHQPYPPQQYGAPQPYPQQQPYSQVPPQQFSGQQPAGQQQYPGQQVPGQPFPGQPYGQPPQFPGQPQGPDQAQDGKKPKKKRSRWAIFFIVLFSPFIALAFVAVGLFWVAAWLLTPAALVVHFVLCGVGLIWFSLVKVLASGGSKYRLFQPMYPQFPPFWTGAYWVRLNKRVRSTFEGLAGILELLNW